MITQALAEFDEPKQAIAMVKSYGTLTLADDGIGKVEQAHKQVKRLRIDIDSRRKSLNEGALTYQRTVNAEAKRLTAEIEPIETALSSQRQIHEEILLKEQQEKHAAKRAVLTARIEKLAQAGCIVNDVAALEAMSYDEFSLHCVSEVNKAVSLRIEQEAARKAAEDIEIARLAEIKRQSEEIRIRQAELDSERKAFETEKAEMQRIKNAEDARLAVIAAEQKEVARQARLEALKPEIEKAAMFANRLAEMSAAVLVSMEKPVWGPSAMMIIRQAGIDVIKIARGEG
jgi:hypothetical protein